MIAFALISLAVSPMQSVAVPYSAEIYRAPAVRPFEPPSNFGRVMAEGDGGGDVRRRPIPAPVSVEDYARSYEYALSGADTAYDAGVANAERNMDGRMGPLDGRWRLSDAEGRPLMVLSLMDQGVSRPLEGAYRTADARSAVGPLATLEREADTLVLTLDGARLSLRPAGDAWTGVLAKGGREQSVTLAR